MSAFKYDVANGKAEAKLYSMFKFPESNRVHFQCDILVCNGKCGSSFQRHIILFGRFGYSKRYIYIMNCITLLARSDDCKTPICDFKEKSGRSLNENPDALLQPAEEGALMASYSVFVLEPGEQVGQYIFYIFHTVE